jgi:hypothetical protein
LLRLRLSDAGVAAFLQDEHITQIHPWRAAAIGGVRVQVSATDFDLAQRIISESSPESAGQSLPVDPDALECCSCRASMAPQHVRCPSCGWSYEDRVENE